MDPDSPGDMACAPHLYHDLGGDVVERDIREIVGNHGDVAQFDAVIVGGGGLLNSDHCQDSIPLLLNLARKLVFWGVGANNHFVMPGGLQTWEDFWPLPVSQLLRRGPAVLVGIRDPSCEGIPGAPAGMFWRAPCASCAHPWLAGLRGGDGTGYFLRWPMPADEVSFGDALRVISGHDMVWVLAEMRRFRRVVTDSYHVAQWASWAGLEFAVVRPHSVKFLLQDGWKISDMRAPVFNLPGVPLSRAVRAGQKFHRRVMQLLED